MLKLSKFMRLRDGKVSREISDFTSKMTPTTKRFELFGREYVWQDVKDFSFEFIQMNDRATVGVVWYGAFNKGLDDNANLKQDEQIAKAVEYADIVVQTTQPSSIPIDLSATQRSEGALRLFTSFSTFTMGVYGNRVMYKWRAWRDGAITNRQYFRHIMYDTVLSSFALLAIGTLFADGELPDKEELAAAPLATQISWMPWVRDITSLKYGRDIGTTTAFELPMRYVKAYDSTKYSIINDKNWNRALWDIGRAVEISVGVPALNLVKDTLNTYDIITDSNALGAVSGRKKRRK